MKTVIGSLLGLLVLISAACGGRGTSTTTVPTGTPAVLSPAASPRATAAPSPSETITPVMPSRAAVASEARAIARRYNAALSKGRCARLWELGGKNAPKGSYADYCNQPLEYYPGGRAIRLQITEVSVSRHTAEVFFVQKACVIGAVTGDPQTRTFVGFWTIDTELDEIVGEVRQLRNSEYECEPPLLGG